MVKTKHEVVTHECDVLVVGGGIAGMEAALRVVSLGQTAIILDKGIFGHSGTSGMNWGHTYQSMEYSADDDATIANGLCNKVQSPTLKRQYVVTQHLH